MLTLKNRGWSFSDKDCTVGFIVNYRSWQSQGLTFWCPMNDPVGYEYLFRSTPITTLGGTPLPEARWHGRQTYFTGTARTYAYRKQLPTLGYPGTVTFWASIGSGNRRGAIFKIGTAPNGWGLGAGNGNWDTLGTDLIALYEGVAWKSFGTTIPTLHHHYAMTVSSGRAPSLYVDGVLQATLGADNINAPSAGEISLGGYITNARYFNGVRMSDFRIYDRELTAGEIGDIYVRGMELYAPAISEMIGLPIASTAAKHVGWPSIGLHVGQESAMSVQVGAGYGVSEC